MTWDVAVAGTLHIDDITTPHGRAVSHGGSAAYFALAAARYAPVHVNGITGAETARWYEMLFGESGIDPCGLAVGDTGTTRWHAVHDFAQWVTASESVEPGCDSEWAGTLSQHSREAEVLFLASFEPSKQRTARAESGARLVGFDSMVSFITAAPQEITQLLSQCDVAFFNQAELLALTRDPDWRRAARRLCDAYGVGAVVVKRGPAGAACVSSRGVIEEPAVSIDVVDPTGAGDALAGGFLGYCATVERADDHTYQRALREGIRCASMALTSFGLDGLRCAKAPYGAPTSGDV